MKMKLGKVGLLFLVLTLVLASMGVGYAMWDKTLTITGTVSTGEVDVEFSGFIILDPWEGPGPPPDYHCNDGFVPNAAGEFYWLDPDGKNVGWVTAQLVDTEGDLDKDTLELTLHNMYPSYFNSISVYVHNNGTVPVIIDHVIISSPYETHTLTANSYVALDLTDDGLDDIEMNWGNNFGLQLEPCQTPDPQLSFWIHILQHAPQGQSDLAFTIEIIGVQWNEY